MAKEYFSDLNYTLANEDTEIEYGLLGENAERVFSIAGSGARCLPLISKNPKEIDVVDMSESQLFLVELRLQAMKALTYEEYLFFMGYRGAVQGVKPSPRRADLFYKLEMTEKARAYWQERVEGWEATGFIRLGKWESHFQKLGSLFRDVLKCDFSKVFAANSLEEQKELYEKAWPHLRWNSFIRVAASEYVFNKYLYKGHFSGRDGKTEERSSSQFIMEEFKRVFMTQLVRQNYFMQTLFLGKIQYEEGLPLEAHLKVFNAVKKSQTKVNYILGNLVELLPQHAYSFISLSDTISYLEGSDANGLLQRLHPETPSGARIVIRSFMRAAKKMNSTGWSYLDGKSQEAQSQDGTGVYQFHIYQKD